MGLRMYNISYDGLCMADLKLLTTSGWPKEYNFELIKTLRLKLGEFM